PVRRRRPRHTRRPGRERGSGPGSDAGGISRASFPHARPARPMSAHTGSGRAVTIRPDGIDLVVGERETIVDALRRQGLRTRYKCRRGGCGACRATLVEGEVAYPKAVSATVVDGPEPRPDIRHCLP